MPHRQEFDKAFVKGSWQQNDRLILTVAKGCVLALVALVGVLILLTSLNYFPPRFDVGFLKGRERYFYSWYAVAFYTHVFSTPVALFTGLLQSFHWLRIRHLQLHRSLGKVYVFAVLLFVTPSGLAMAFRADGSRIAFGGFAVLALMTAWTTWLGFHHIRQGDVRRHRHWITRSYLLVCSAVTLRFLAAFASEFQLSMDYDATAWLCWVPQLAAYEVFRIARQS